MKLEIVVLLLIASQATGMVLGYLLIRFLEGRR